MKVILINPPPSTLFQPKACISLGLAYIGAVLRANGLDVDIIQLEDRPFEEITLDMLPDADWYGIKCISATYPAVVKICRLLKGKNIVVGGLYPTIMPYKLLKETDASYVITGEGEYAFTNFLLNGHQNSRVIEGGLIRNLDSLPLPARDLFDYDDVVDTVGIHGFEKGVKATSVVTSRGCPYNCSFCTKQYDLYRLCRYRSAKNIRDELIHVIATYRITHFKFIDEFFTHNRRRVLNLCKAIKELGIRWISMTGPEYIDAELLESMKNAGCIEIDMGVKSGSPRLLNRMHTKETPDMYLKASKMIKKAGLTLKTYMMYGFPTETGEEILRTITLTKQMEPDKVTVSRFTVWGGVGETALTSLQQEQQFDADWQPWTNRLETVNCCRSGILFNENNDSRIESREMMKKKNLMKMLNDLILR